MGDADRKILGQKISSRLPVLLVLESKFKASELQKTPPRFGATREKANFQRTTVQLISSSPLSLSERNNGTYDWVEMRGRVRRPQLKIEDRTEKFLQTLAKRAQRSEILLEDIHVPDLVVHIKLQVK